MASTLVETRQWTRSILGGALIAGTVIGCGGSARVIGDGVSGGGGFGVGGSAGSGASGGAITFAGSAPFAGAGGTTSNAGTAGSTGGANGAALSPGSWNVNAQLTFQGASTISGTCPSVEFTLNLSADQHVTVGHDGQMDVAHAQLFEDYVVDTVMLPTTSAGCSASSLQVNHLRLVAAFETDRIVGSADGTIQFAGGDVISSNPVSVVISGVTDRDPPQLSVPTAVLSPLDTASFSASEPLGLSATSLQLVGSATVPLVAQLQTASDGEPPSSAIRWTNETILPLSGEWTVQGKGADLVGLELNSMGSLRTLSDPGVFAQDGFESPLVAAIDAGSPQIVSGVGSLPHRGRTFAVARRGHGVDVSSTACGRGIEPALLRARAR